MADALPPGTRAVRLLWTDCAGLRRARVVPALTWPDAVSSGGIALAETCPRSALAAAAAALASQGLSVRVGVEVEFRLIARPGGGGGCCCCGGGGGSRSAAPAATGPASYALDSTLGPAAAVLDAIVDSLASAGIPVLHYHGESGAGAFEVVTAPCADLVEAADGLLHTRAVIAAVAGSAGYDVTFAPKPVPTEAGLGAHVHISLWSADGRDNLTAAGSVPGAPPGPAHPTGRAFLAGIVARLPGLVALTAGSPSSFARAQPGCWAGAHARWGVEDKEAAVRFVPGTGPAAGRFEVKAVDGSCNPYIGLAAIVAAGLRGVVEGAVLAPPAAEADAPRLPGSVTAALAELAAPALAAALSPIIPPRLLALVAAVRRADEAAAREAGEERARQGYVKVYA